MVDGLAELDLATLRARRDEVRREEAAVSYRRRLLQAQLDIVAGLRDEVGESLSARLAALLADETGGAGPARAVATTVDELEPPPPLPDDLGELDAAERDALAGRLADQESALSTRRRELLDELDELQEELVRRYRDGGVDAAALLGGDR